MPVPYYNPGIFPASYAPIGYQYPQQQQPMQMTGQNAMTYMYQVDGESAARAWQAPAGQLPPNTIVPLFDVDGEHIYFKSTDMYGRINPIRKGRVVIEEEQQVLPQGQSGDAPDMSKYMTKEDMNSFKQELKDELRNMLAQNNQNGRRNNDQNANRGENR